MKKISLFMMLLLCIGVAFAQNKRPNIVFIFSDDHAYQATSAYGNKLIQTPGIDRIAKDGALLENNFVTNSICGPSRATLLTGKYSHKNGFYDNTGKKFDTAQLVFPELLQKNGYQTAWIGKMHLHALPRGFDYLNVLAGAGGQGTYFNPDFVNQDNDTASYKGYVTNLITDFFFDWLSNRDTSKPFFALVGEKATHRTWLPDIPDLGAYDDIDFPLPDDFFDNYDTRLAAKDQDMTIDKTMRLKEDLKVGEKFGTDITDEDIDQQIRNLQKQNPNYKVNKAQFRKGSLDSAQTKAYRAYYGKITKEFEEKKLTGKELVKWKYQRYLKDYYATAKSMDRNIEKILHYLDSTGLSKNTVVIYASDQGFYLGEHGWFDKRFIYEQSLKTSFLIKYPGVIKSGIRVNDFVSNIDWAPTVLDIAGVKSPAEIQGQSFLPALKQQTPKDWRKDFYYHYYEYPQPHHVSPHFGIRTKDYLLVRFYKGVESWELFDLKKDPDELNNVYADVKYQKIVADLKSRLKKLILQYDDKDALEIFNQQLP
ncbi:sulfatase [Terrimonas sp.]|uniref:sulfatase family protein n=1 Tax=Terrimonas sp. TaxID=1914338 RepID=UPI000D51E3B0|nr:sulfatase [Terrimonas sp.]PVD51967.1 sulfatase [Terrimonas sp.]